MTNLIDYQAATRVWLEKTFPSNVWPNREERLLRFIEEATELVQSLGLSQERAAAIVDYVYNRPLGEPKQEVGGSIVTLAALCAVFDINLDAAASDELIRCFANHKKIASKQMTKTLRGEGIR